MREMLTVSDIYISPAKGEPMRRVYEVSAVKGVGLEGDRYAKGTGFWQTVANPRDVARQVSIVSENALVKFGFSGEMSRRNILISGDEIDFRKWVRQEFFIAGVRMRGVELCEPCNRPSKLSGLPGFDKLPAEAGGLRAEILENGVIFTGAPIGIPHTLRKSYTPKS